MDLIIIYRVYVEYKIEGLIRHQWLNPIACGMAKHNGVFAILSACQAHQFWATVWIQNTWVNREHLLENWFFKCHDWPRKMSVLPNLQSLSIQNSKRLKLCIWHIRNCPNNLYLSHTWFEKGNNQSGKFCMMETTSVISCLPSCSHSPFCEKGPHIKKRMSPPSLLLGD